MQGNDMINLDRTTATRRARIDSLRKTALVAGDLPDHLVSIPTLSLYGPVRNNPNYVLGPGPGHSHAGGLGASARVDNPVRPKPAHRPRCDHEMLLDRGLRRQTD
jgi:hypothetical protein